LNVKARAQMSDDTSNWHKQNCKRQVRNQFTHPFKVSFFLIFSMPPSLGSGRVENEGWIKIQ